jgi:hypothetical protein
MRLVRKSKDYTDEYGEVWEGAKYYEWNKGAFGADLLGWSRYAD